MRIPLFFRRCAPTLGGGLRPTGALGGQACLLLLPLPMLLPLPLLLHHGPGRNSNNQVTTQKAQATTQKKHVTTGTAQVTTPKAQATTQIAQGPTPKTKYLQLSWLRLDLSTAVPP